MELLLHHPEIKSLHLGPRPPSQGGAALVLPSLANANAIPANLVTTLHRFPT